LLTYVASGEQFVPGLPAELTVAIRPVNVARQLLNDASCPIGVNFRTIVDPGATSVFVLSTAILLAASIAWSRLSREARQRQLLHGFCSTQPRRVHGVPR
jgi:hypothetical protein